MGANIEHQFLCKVVELQDFHTVEKLRISEEYFLGRDDSPYKEIFRFLRNHFHNPITHGSVPSWQLLTQHFPQFAWVSSWDTLPTLCEELRKARLRAQIVMLADEINSKADVDPRGALNTIREAASSLVSQHEISRDVLLSNAYERILDNYHLVANGQGLTGIPWPWDILNEDTQGHHPGEFTVIYGRPKSMKTWIALVSAMCAYSKGYRVLIYSMEMSPIQILRRCAAILAMVEYDKFKNAKLDPATYYRTFQILMNLKNQEQTNTTQLGHQPALLATSPGGEGGGGISSLHAKIREFSPDIAVVDGMYLMRDDRQKVRTMDWKAIAHISQDLKQTAQTFDIPVIGVTQASRKASDDPEKADLAEISYADALGQDCDLAVRVHKQKDAQGENEIVLGFPGSREGKLDAFVINGIPAVNFHFKRATTIDPNAPATGKNGQGGGGSGGGGKKAASATRGVPTLPNWRQP